jgi:diketogulonate reductase-like aldo/keto reductase
VDEGLVKGIGLSNFNQQQIQNILDNSRIKPSNLQVCRSTNQGAETKKKSLMEK